MWPLSSAVSRAVTLYLTEGHIWHLVELFWVQTSKVKSKAFKGCACRFSRGGGLKTVHAGLINSSFTHLTGLWESRYAFVKGWITWLQRDRPRKLAYSSSFWSPNWLMLKSSWQLLQFLLSLLLWTSAPLNSWNFNKLDLICRTFLVSNAVEQ